MQILNTICPRPVSLSHSIADKSVGVSHSSNHPSNDNEESVNANRYDNNRTSPLDRHQDPRSLNKSRNKKSFLSLFRSKNCDVPDTTVILTPMEEHDYNGDTQSKNMKNAKSGKDSDWSAKLVAKTDDMTHLLLAEYGPPLYGMSVACWTLLVMARRAAEEVLALDFTEIGLFQYSVSVIFLCFSPFFYSILFSCYHAAHHFLFFSSSSMSHMELYVRMYVWSHMYAQNYMYVWNHMYARNYIYV